MVIEGLKLTILGMGMVFIFLVLLVTLIQVSSSILASTTQKELRTLEETSNKSSESSKKGINNKSTLIAVITAAINVYRKNN